MSNDSNKRANLLDSGLAAMRNDSPSAEQIANASSRVLHQLQAEHARDAVRREAQARQREAGINVVPHPAAAEAAGADRIRSCDDFRALIPAYLSSSLTASRKLLFEDHVHECVVCRKALEGERATVGAVREAQAGQRAASRNERPGGPRSASASARSLKKFPPLQWLKPPLQWRWVGAAAVAAAIVLAFQFTAVRDLFWPIDVHAMVQAVEGGLYSVDGQTVRPIGAGQRIARGNIVRTGNASGAILRLADGSSIEMNARSELFLDRARDGMRINVNRGSVIVAAAKQHGGHLYAATKELGVSVVGTVFEVNAGVKGSRVTVIEGEVRVQQGQDVQPLKSGQQLSTDAAMPAIPVQQEISWSRDLSRYLTLLKLTEDVAQRIPPIPARHSSDLVPLVPETTVIFASLPNISQSIAEPYALFKQRINDNPLLADWWLQHGNRPAAGPMVDQMVDRLTRVGAYLGAEVIFAFPQDTNAEAPVLLADTASPDQLATALMSSGAPVARSIPEVQALVASKKGVFYVGEGLLIAAGDGGQVLRSLRFRSQPAANSFASTSLYRRLAQAYTEGVGWLLAADLDRLVGSAPGREFQQTGIGDVQDFMVQQTTEGSASGYRATLGFKQSRRGMAAWLAGPSPMGALEFVSPNAFGVAGVVTKDPSLMFDDILAIIQGDTQAVQDFQNYQREHRVDIRRDLVAPLGNELLVAVDGPILPTPSWKIVIEVNDAARLQNTIEASIADVNREAAAHQESGVTLRSETAGGRTFHSLTGAKFPTEIHYTYWAGYMIIAPSRAMLTEAIQNHDTGNSLLRSAAFRSQLPSDGHDYASGFVYQNIQAMAKSLPVDVLKQTPTNALPSLVCIYGEPERIVMSSKGVLGMNIASVTGITGMLNFTGLKRFQ